MSTALRVFDFAFLFLSLDCISFLFFLACNYIYFSAAPAFPSFRHVSILFFWLPGTFHFDAASAPGAQIRDRIQDPGQSGLLMRALMEYAHTHSADPHTRTHA